MSLKSAVPQQKAETAPTLNRRAGQEPSKLDSWKGQNGGRFGTHKKQKHTTNYTELNKEEKVWMQHHITGKWDTPVQVIRKRKDGNSYVVPAPDRNTYIRGRRLLKPISSPNTNPETTAEDTRTNNLDQEKPSVNSVKEKAMQGDLPGTTSQRGQQTSRSRQGSLPFTSVT